jgi:hypothetical protein
LRRRLDFLFFNLRSRLRWLGFGFRLLFLDLRRFWFLFLNFRGRGRCRLGDILMLHGNCSCLFAL